MHPPSPVQPPSAAVTPRARATFVPEPMEPTVIGGSPRPRRRREHGATAPEFVYKDMQPTVLPSGALTDEAMVAAFGQSALFCAPHTEAESRGDDDDVLDRLKNLNVADILRHFRGDGVLPSPPINPSMTTAPPSIAGLRGTAHWPAL